MKRTIVYASLAVLGTGIFVLGYFAQDVFLHFHKPRVLARVNKTEITDVDLEREIFFLQANDNTAIPTANRQEILDRLINDALILQEAQRLKIRVPEAAVNSRVAASWEGYSKSEISKALKENHLSSGTWQNLSRKQLLIETTIQRRIESQVSVADEEVDAYYWSHLLEFYRPLRVHARQIVVETLAQAQTLKQQLQAGGNFQQLAAKFSRGPERDQGGDLGWVGQNELPQAFSQVLFRLQPGEVSDPVATEYGFHLFLVEAKEAGGKMPIEEAKQKVAQDLKLEKVDRAFQAWLEELHAKAKILIGENRGEE